MSDPLGEKEKNSEENSNGAVEFETSENGKKDDVKDRKSADWKTGVAFVKGINFFGNLRITKVEMLALARQVESDDLIILDIIRADNIVFRKRNMHFATVGSKLELIISEHFKRPIAVTTRSLRTVKQVCKRF